jgi:hypothetical protein
MPSGVFRVNTRSSGTERTPRRITIGTGRRYCKGGEIRGFCGIAVRRLQLPDLEGFFPSGGVSWESLWLFASVRPVRWRRPDGSGLKGRRLKKESRVRIKDIISQNIISN